jgi:hypothetical protein
MIEDLFHLPRVSTTPLVHLSCEYLPEFLKKFITSLMVYSGTWGKKIHEKNRSRKSRDTVPLKECFRGSIQFKSWIFNQRMKE